MKIYIDGLFFLNFAFDFILLLTTNIVLKRNVKTLNIIIGAFIGSLSIITLFLKINTAQLFLLKIYLSIIMNLTTFNYKNFKYTLRNITTFYILSILLGGFLYLLNIEFSKQNIVVLFILSPTILYIYIWQNKYQKTKINKQYKVDVKLGKKNLNLTGYLDTGNTLIYKGKPVIITNKKIKTKKKKIIIPYSTVGFSGLIECIEVTILVHNLGQFDVYLGYSENLNISDVDILLNNEMEKIKW